MKKTNPFLESFKKFKVGTKRVIHSGEIQQARYAALKLGLKIAIRGDVMTGETYVFRTK